MNKIVKADVFMLARGGFRSAKGHKKSSQDKFMSRDEAKALLVAASNDDRRYGQDAWCLFALAVNFGFRCSEGIDLEREDFKTLPMGYFRVRTLKRRGVIEDRVIVDPAHAELARDILSYRTQMADKLFPFSSRMARYLFAFYAEKAGLSRNVSFHALRHTGARMVLEATGGGDPAKGQMRFVKAFLRHRPTPAEIYTEPTPDEMVSMMKMKGVIR